MPEQPKPDERFPLGAAFGIYTLAFVALAFPWLTARVAIPYDAASQFYPQLVFLARSIAAGQSPFWTPNIYAGWPQIADPQSLIFSPLHVLLALVDPHPSQQLFDALTFLLLYAGGAAVIMIFRDRRWHVAGAVVAALAFAFGGSASARIQHIGQIESLALLLPALWLLTRALERSSTGAGLGAGVIAALIVLGRDQVALLAVYVLAGYVVWHWLDGPGRAARLVASAKPLAAGAVAGAVIVPVPVVLTWLLAGISNRPDIGYGWAVEGSLHPTNLIMFAFAGVFGSSDFSREFWGVPSLIWEQKIGPTGLWNSQNMGEIYCGALVAIALFGFSLQRGVLWARDIRFHVATAVLLLLYALGKYTPAFTAMYHVIPGVHLYRRPADATFILCALLAIIAGYLVHRWLTGTIVTPSRWQWAMAIALVAVQLAITLGLALYVGEAGNAAAPMLWGTGCLVAAAVALALARKLEARGALAATAFLAAFSVGDLAFNNAPNESTGLPFSRFEAMRRDTSDEIVAFLKARLRESAAPDRRDRVELIGIDYHWPNIGLIHDFDHVFGHNPLRLAGFARATNAPDTVAGGLRRFTPLMPNYRSTLERLFGARLIVLDAPAEQYDTALKPGDLKLIGRPGGKYVYENPQALPRVLLATKWRKADFEDMLQHGGWPDIDPAQTVLLEDEPPGAPMNDAGGTARIVRYENTAIEIEAEAPQGGFVALNDVWHPWWRAAVDGTPAEILKANVLFRAVVVPPGKHTVRFTFHPFEGAWAELRQRLSAAHP